jgi:hypothetical protein
MCSSRSWLIKGHLAPSWRASCAGLQRATGRPRTLLRPVWRETAEHADGAIHQRPGERGCAAAHVDEGSNGRDPGRAEHPKRHVRMFLEPAPRVVALGVDGMLVRPCLCPVCHLLILRAARASQIAGLLAP